MDDDEKSVSGPKTAQERNTKQPSAYEEETKGFNHLDMPSLGVYIGRDDTNLPILCNCSFVNQRHDPSIVSVSAMISLG